MKKYHRYSYHALILELNRINRLMSGRSKTVELSDLKAAVEKEIAVRKSSAYRSRFK